MKKLVWELVELICFLLASLISYGFHKSFIGGFLLGIFVLLFLQNKELTEILNNFFEKDLYESKRRVLWMILYIGVWAIISILWYFSSLRAIALSPNNSFLLTLAEISLTLAGFMILGRVVEGKISKNTASKTLAKLGLLFLLSSFGFYFRYSYHFLDFQETVTQRILQYFVELVFVICLMMFIIGWMWLIYHVWLYVYPYKAISKSEKIN